MPRQKQIVMGAISKDETHEAAIRAALKKAKPYEIIPKHAFGLSKRREWMIIYKGADAPKPVVIVDKIRKQKKAKKLKALLERAWAEGSYSSGLK